MSDEDSSLNEPPEGWIVASVRTLVDQLQYGVSTKADAAATTGVPIVRMSNIQDGRLDLSDLKYVPRGPDLESVYLSRGDVLFNRTNSPELVGKAAVVDVDASLVFASYLIRLRVRAGVVEPRYLCWWINSAWGRGWAARVRTDGVSQSNINGTKLGEMPLPLAPFPEQRRIVAQVETLLEQVRRAKGRLDRVPLILRSFRQSVLAAACSGELTKEWRGEHAAAEAWRDVALGDLLREPLRNGHSAKQSSDGKGVPTFSLSAFTNGDFSERNVKMTVADPAKVQDLWALPDDIYIERSNTPELVGTARLYDGPERKAIVPDLVIRVRVKVSEALPRFVEHCLRSKAGRDYFIDRAQGTAGSMPKIDQGAVLAFPISLPTPDEQAEVVRQVEQLFALADTIERRVQAATARADKLPQAILSKAFSGELVPTEAELARAEGRTYETAEELLKRTAESRATASKPAAKKRRRTA